MDIDKLETIKKLAFLGDQMAKTLESYEHDKVISNYLRNMNDASSQLRTEWDCLIGDLQEAGIVGPEKDEHADYLLEEL